MKHLSCIVSLLLAYCLSTSPCFAQKKTPGFNVALKKTLDSIAAEDQRYRLVANNLTKDISDSLAGVYHVPAEKVYDHLMALQDASDSTNVLFAESILKTYGYPGKSLVGVHTNESVFYVIQHSTKIKEYLPMLQKAARQGELPTPLVAMMEDRLLTQEQKEQIYGTQLWGNPVKDTLTGVTKPVFYFNPIAEPRNVNKRRRKAGFKTTIEEYAAEMGVPYLIKTPWWWKGEKE